MSQASTSPWGAIVSADDCEPDEAAAPSASQAGAMGPTPTMMQQITPEMVEAGYQPGMASQSIVVTGKKGPKVPMIIAAVFLVIGILGFVIGGIAGAALEETLEGIETGPYTSDHLPEEALIHTDDDNAGEMGWYLLISGDPKADENSNGIPDACDALGPLSITDADGDDIGERVATIDCAKVWDYYDIEDHVVVGVICSTINDQDDGARALNDCEIREKIFVSNNNNVSMKVVDLDAMFIPVMGEIVGEGAVMGTSFFAGCCSICGGLIALVVGLMRFGGNKQPAIQYQIK
jgi:hypothetical protein